MSKKDLRGVILDSSVKKSPCTVAIKILFILYIYKEPEELRYIQNGA